MQEPKIIAKCKQGECGIITVAGQWLPCCNFYKLNTDNKPLDYNVEIFNTPIFSVKDSEEIKFHELQEFKQWLIDVEKDYDQSPLACKTYCSSINDNDYFKSNFWCKDDIHFISNEDDLTSFMKENDVF